MEPADDNNGQQRDTWQSYVPEGKLFRNQPPPQPSATWPAMLTPTQTPVHSLQDDRWKSAQHATQRLIKRSTGQDPPTPLAPAFMGHIGAEEESEEQDHGPHMQPLEEASRRDADLELFASTMQRRPLRPSTQLVLEAPPATEVLALCAQYKHTLMPWWKGAQVTIAANPGLSLPKMPIYSRAYLAPFMREPDPKASYERPCLNLDRDPYPGEEGRLRCIAHQLSERRFGPRGAYRLRELLHSATTVQINAALNRIPAKRGDPAVHDPRIHLSEVPEVCVMCHVWMVFDEALNQKNRREERLMLQRMTEKNGTLAPNGPNGADMVMILNKFMVHFDKPGEYSRYALLAGDEVGLGVYGSFPLWQERNYLPWVDPAGTGLRGFQEAEDMLFQQAPAPSRVIESIQVIPEDASSRSNRTSATPAATKSRR